MEKIFLGIDPGLATIGFGVIKSDGDKHIFVDCGVIKTPAGLSLEERLHSIKEDCDDLVRTIQPDAAGVEELFFAKNVTNAIKVAHARGVLLESIFAHNIPLFEMTPLQIKNNICGYGQADKIQMQEMIKRLLNLSGIPRSDDAADALGIAICTARLFHTKQTGIKNEN
ncbi:crossover junction endodeoxyribonuclease RuvC [Candidatus Peregrinibacteria bacterium CG_4_10_14_0_2_um_filter_43_11]|nr:MAG: crossover junction endodeoxyribonuclease RuvC [Candidatus Peregrinibacteria bacterium CG_4_10_14_0_2_um_filter_43_11]